MAVTFKTITMIAFGWGGLIYIGMTHGADLAAALFCLLYAHNLEHHN